MADDDYVSSRVWNYLLSKENRKPVTKRDRDIHQRTMLGALASCKIFRLLEWKGYRETDSCPFCGESEDIVHMSMYYARLNMLSLHDTAVLK